MTSGHTDPADDDELMTVELGYDVFRAHVLLEACRAEGIKCELLRMDEWQNGQGISAGISPQLLIRKEDAERVTAVLRRTEG